MQRAQKQRIFGNLFFPFIRTFNTIFSNRICAINVYCLLWVCVAACRCRSRCLCNGKMVHVRRYFLTVQDLMLFSAQLSFARLGSAPPNCRIQSDLIHYNTLNTRNIADYFSFGINSDLSRSAPLFSMNVHCARYNFPGAKCTRRAIAGVSREPRDLHTIIPFTRIRIIYWYGVFIIWILSGVFDTHMAMGECVGNERAGPIL